jgi:hypothetical protein
VGTKIEFSSVEAKLPTGGAKEEKKMFATVPANLLI